MSVELRDCPFCHKPAVFVGVHDNEGNYKGVPGCEYESDPWSGLSYGLHHKGWETVFFALVAKMGLWAVFCSIRQSKRPAIGITEAIL